MDNNQAIKSEQLIEAVNLEWKLAKETAKGGDRQMAFNHLHHALKRLSIKSLNPDGEALFISVCLEFADLCFLLGRSFDELIMFLQTAGTAAKRLGDRRSRAMINLHLGRLYYFAGRRPEAIKLFEEGKAEAESLGDADMSTRAAEFIGLYYFIHGLFTKAQRHFELAAQSFEYEKQGRVINPSGPMWLSYCSAYLGRFSRAIGTLDYYRRLAVGRSDHALATTLRAVLGLVLLMIRKKKEAAFHLSGALQESIKTDNSLAKFFSSGGLAYHHLLENRLNDARAWVMKTVTEGASSGLVRQYASPFALEMLFEFHRKGIDPIIDPIPHNYPEELQRIMLEPNIHLRGVALRLRATETATGGEDNEIIESDLKLSEKYLIQSGDPIQLGKTRVEMARLKLREGDQEAARDLAQKAWNGFSEYGDLFYPDDLRHLLAIKSDFSSDPESREKLLEMFTDMIQDLIPGTEPDEVLKRTVEATNRFFGAERGGVFWFRRRNPRKGPELRAACNLSRADVATEEFRSNLAMVFRSYRENRPQMVRHEGAGLWPSQVKAALCVPFEVEGRVQGVLYHDNSYVPDCFDYFDRSQLVKIARSLTGYIQHLLAFSRRVEQKASANLAQMGQPNPTEIVTRCPAMLNILDQIDRIAVSDSTVLILGDTGVGKELLALRLHNMSRRRDHPLVVVDPSMMPESLVESELFGHEKGAFTGADRQKPGRLELAHRGTLFIDEVGEIPKSVQVKLLRALQEKTVVRVGGTQTISCDFRLVAATNRDLAEEVSAGRFREDLYYRLNVVPLTLPPLRERKEDILLLAKYYLDRYSSKYNRAAARLMPEDEKGLLAYEWPGNVRELKNVMERAVLLSNDDCLDLQLTTGKKITPNSISADIPTLDEMQRRYIRQVLEITGGKIGGIGGAAKILGMKRTTLNTRMKKLGIVRPKG